MMQRIANVPGVVLVSIAATMWGLDGLIRKPLSHTTTATTIVFGEHIVLVACTITLLVPALASLWRAGPRYVLAGILVGAGASAIATILFTQALFHGDFVTVLVLQKAQPLVAVAGTASRSPRRGWGRAIASMSTSPDSQCLPAMRNTPSGSSSARFASSAS